MPESLSNFSKFPSCASIDTEKRVLGGIIWSNRSNRASPSVKSSADSPQNDFNKNTNVRRVEPTRFIFGFQFSRFIYLYTNKKMYVFVYVYEYRRQPTREEPVRYQRPKAYHRIPLRTHRINMLVS